MAEQEMKAGDNPADYNVEPVVAYLADADAQEVQRVLDAETGPDGKDRQGVKDAAQARLEEGAGSPEEKPSQPEGGVMPATEGGLASTGNPADLSVPYSSPTTGVGHQDGAPEALVRQVEEAEKVGFVQTTQAPVSKPDYSQRSSFVMNQSDTPED